MLTETFQIRLYTLHTDEPLITTSAVNDKKGLAKYVHRSQLLLLKKKSKPEDLCSSTLLCWKKLSQGAVALSLSLIIPAEHILTLQTPSHRGKVKMKLLAFLGKNVTVQNPVLGGFFVCLFFLKCAFTAKYRRMERLRLLLGKVKRKWSLQTDSRTAVYETGKLFFILMSC